MIVLWLTQEQARFITQHAFAESPREACGILGGSGGRVTQVISIPNDAADPQHFFEMEPALLAQAFFDLQRDGLTLLGFYHSHPRGKPIPSTVDIDRALYPDAAYLIVGLQDDEARLAAWQIRYRQVQSVTLHVGDGPPEPVEEMNGVQRIAILLSAIIAVLIVLVVSLALLPPPPILPLR